jgi:hypothetical protein
MVNEMSRSRVMTCLAEDCSYNCRDECCAPKVEVGEDHPRCDTFTTGEVSIGIGEPPVQDCMVTDCHYNESMACNAAGITMSTHSEHADCLTFRT